MSDAQSLNDEQRETIRELQRELAAIDLKADIEWAKYIHTRDEDCLSEVMALEAEREMKGLIAYVPKAGEMRVSKVRKLIAKLQGKAGPKLTLHKMEARLRALDGINEWRESYGLPPLDRLPQGIPGDSHECTLAKAFHMSMKDMGATSTYVSVGGGGNITLSGMLPDGQSINVEEGDLNLGDAGDTVVSEFDENAWLDLLTDGSLEGYAKSVIENEEWDRLQEISDEFAYRKRHVTVSGGYYANVDTIDLGLGATSIKAQVPAARYEEAPLDY